MLGLAFRRSEQSSGGELTALGVALALNALADVVYIQSTSSGTYATGVWLDGIWFLGYAALAAAGYLAMRPKRSHELRFRAIPSPASPWPTGPCSPCWPWSWRPRVPAGGTSPSVGWRWP